MSNGIFEIVSGKNHLAEHVYTVVVKRSYKIRHGQPLERMEEDNPLRQIDAYYDQGDPEWATLQYEYETAPFKPKVDVVVIGKAYACGGRPTQHTKIGVRVAGHKKIISVFGNRSCHYRKDLPPTISEPETFTQMAIRYEQAYGGCDLKSQPDLPFYYPRNFLGTGVVVGNNEDSVQDLVMPNLEDPDDLLTPERLIIGDPKNWPTQPIPQGLGWLQRSWYPRCAYVGAYPAHTDPGTITKEERMGLVPENHITLAKQFKLPSYDAHFNNGASFGLVIDKLEGGEEVNLRGLSMGGKLDFLLAKDTPKINLDIGKGEQSVDVRLDTVSIRPDDLEVDLIWRGSHVYEGYSWWPKMKRLHAEVQ